MPASADVNEPATSSTSPRPVTGEAVGGGTVAVGVGPGAVVGGAGVALSVAGSGTTATASTVELALAVELCHRPVVMLSSQG